MDESGITQAVKRFFDNDPYYPRPHASTTSEQRLWEIFKQRYLEVSKTILGAEYQDLPTLFMEGISQTMLIRIQKKAEAAKVSDVYSEAG